MTNLEIKKEILRATKRIDFKLELILWTGDGCGYEQGSKIYNVLDIIDLATNEVIENDKIILPSDLLELFDNETDYKILRKEQKKLYTYLSKDFDIIIKEETC